MANTPDTSSDLTTTTPKASPPPPTPPAPTTPAVAESKPETATLLVPDAEGVINVGGRFYNAIAGEVEVAIHEVHEFLRRVPGSAIKGSNSES